MGLHEQGSDRPRSSPLPLAFPSTPVVQHCAFQTPVQLDVRGPLSKDKRIGDTLLCVADFSVPEL